jgi:hypothetical protein
MSVLQKRHADMMAKLLKPGEQSVSEVFLEGEVSWQTEEAIAEASGGKKKRGRLGQMTYEFRTADVLNGNRRIYPSAIVKIAVTDLQQRIAKNVVFGNLDHPSMWDPESLIVKLSEACVKVVECRMTTDTNVRVVLDILDNEHGEQLISVLNVGGNPGISQRGVVKWREANPAERELYKIPENTYAVVAEVLRLITYDVVSEPGFVDADEATITESKTAGEDTMTLEELKQKHPGTYQLVIAEGRAAALAEVNEKVAAGLAAQKPTIVAEAIDPLNKQIAELTAQRDESRKALEALKPAMVKLGLVNEQITDAQAAAKIVTLEGQIKELDGKLKTAQTELEAKANEAKVLKDEQSVAEALKHVSEAFKAHPAHNLILQQVAPKKIGNKEQALEAAKGIATFIESVNPALKPAANGGTPPVNPASAGGLVSATLEALLQNPANPGAGSGGNQGVIGTAMSAEAKSAHAILSGAMPSIL